MRYLLACLFVLYGCATPRPVSYRIWTKEGVTDLETLEASRACENDNSAGVVGDILFGPIRSYYYECMRGKGFTEKK